MGLNDHFPTTPLSRRTVVAGATMALMAGVSRAWATTPLTITLPDPAVKILDPAFNAVINTLSNVEKVASGFEWTEGPVWLGEASLLVFSDIRGDRLMKWDALTQETSPFRTDSHFANGNTVDRQGRLVTCECGSRSITRTEYDGTVTTLSASFEGKPYNSPNDIVCKSDGSIWFTDPAFGPNVAEGNFAPDMPARVYRLDPASGKVTVVADDVPGPNGLCFSVDERTLYIVASRHEPNRQIWRYPVNGDRLGARGLFVDCGKGAADGLRCDIHDNLWCGWGMGAGLDGVVVFDRTARMIGRIDLPERCPNVCFGGVHRNELYMAGHTAVYRLVTKTRGAV